MRRGYLHSSLLTVLLLSATPVFSQNAEQAPLQMQNDAKAQKWQLTPWEIDVFQRTKTSVEDTITLAQPHGKVVDVTFRVENGAPVYQVKAVQNDEVWEGMINAGTGIPIGREKLLQKINSIQKTKPKRRPFKKPRQLLQKP